MQKDRNSSVPVAASAAGLRNERRVAPDLGSGGSTDEFA
jgi:hypothetical protein